MVPRPKKQTPQRQPLTVSLRKICRDYPAGAGILKELLQNADDAGASTIKFILDTSTHPDSPLLVDGLSEYQGPALLAYNDALFSERDFQSLTSLGDSKKIQDKAATGKFGLGFSSVFNWTDCPSVLSGENLLFLDPHNSWSRCFDPPGGPHYEFPSSAKDKSMINQLDCFSLLNTEWERPFDGTIIRIPLRNASQAARSEISKTETTKTDVQNALESFADDMGSNGLLFLKSVQRIVLSINNEQLSDVKVINTNGLTGPKQRLGNILDNVMNNEDQAGGEVYHEVHLQHKAAGRETLKKFGVLNLVAETVHDRSLDSWAAQEKLFPWVAVAAPLEGFDSSSEAGRLFCTLPLPCSTNLPVHLHGLFSISADRSRVHGLDDSGVQDHRPKEWNKILFDRLIPIAWAKLLQNICQSYPTQDHLHLWPTGRSDTRQLWDGMCRAVVDQVFVNHLPVWYTDAGYVALEHGLLASKETPLKERAAFREACLPIIFVVNHVLDEARRIPGSRTLHPRTLYQLLQQTKKVDSLSSPSKVVLLEYLLRECPITELGTLEIFPFQDGKFRSLNKTAVFLHRSDLEKTLFALQKESTIDTDRLSASASQTMHEHVRKTDHMVRYRSPEDLRHYYLRHIANGSSDTIVLDENGRSTLSQVWKWILQYSQNDLPLSTLGSLWLVPLRGSNVRRLVPADASNFATWFHPGEVNDISLKIVASNPKNTPKVLAVDALSDDISQHLLRFAKTKQALCIKDGNKFENFLDFLAQGHTLLRTAAEDVKNSALCALKQLYWSRSQLSTDRECRVLKTLCLFKAVEWPADAAELSLTRYWTDMTSDVAYIGLKSLVPVPLSPKQVFIDMTDEGVRALFEGLGLLKCLNDLQVLEEIVIPAINRGNYNHMSPKFRLEVVELLFQNYYHISATTRSRLPSLEVVPLKKRTDASSLSFGRPLNILDPQQHALRNLYFEDEISLPEEQFYNRFSAILAECGVVRSLNERVALDRIQCFGRKELGFAMVASRARDLLRLPFRRNSAQPDELTRVARETKWLPARSPDKSNFLVISSKCRDIRDEPFVGHVWHVLPFQVDNSWRSILGWQSSIDVDVLTSQLVASIRVSDLASVERTLSYIWQHHSTTNLAERLLKLNFVRNSKGELVNSGKACRRGGERLMPYLCTVEPRFWDAHVEIMKLTNIPEVPTLKQLQNVQNALGSGNALNERDLDVAVEVARIWSVQFPGSVEGLKLPDNHGMLLDVSDLVFNDTPWLSPAECAIVHPNVSRTTADQLMIEPLSELLRKGDLGITDPDDDEFDQREEVADGIRDTLERYTRESTFHEYLANADDCSSASEVNFLIDGTRHGTKHLLTKDLEELQGPSLFIHNNGVFTDDDFEGLKHVGRGSKRNDANTIGKFGRGSQTMYHWTDVPMILSGSRLLILDPLRKYLPYNYRTRQKKPGVLVEYANLKPTCQDQLAPFEGLWGFDSNRCSYNGTIFRFPLRREGQGSHLLESEHCPNVSMTIEIFRKCFDEARLSLLFLRNLTSIDFSIKRSTEFEWRIRRGTWPQSGSFSDWANIMVEQRNSHGKLMSTTERWWRVIEDVLDPPADLQRRHKRRMKFVECGIAALVPPDDKATRSPLQSLKSRFFNCLPLKFESTLPVHIHATFLLSGDRQNITIEETSQDAGSEWNKWLLEKKLPYVYLQFLEELGRKIGHDVYNYFPTGLSGSQQLSDLIRTSFWEEIKSSRCRLFPVIDASHELSVPRSKGRRNRTPPNLVTFEGAVFDVLEKQNSDALRPILCHCLKNLVRPPWQLRGHIKPVREDPRAKFLTPAIVRGVLKGTEARNLVERIKQLDEGFLHVLLSFVKPETAAEAIELDGCPILPLANGGLGTLSLKSRTGSDNMYFAAKAECQSLFSFASSMFAAFEGHEEFVGKVLDSGLFNLKKLMKGDVSVILNRKESWAPDSTSEKWLLHFWEYMNSSSPSTEASAKPEILNLVSLQHYYLLLLRQHGGKETLTSLHHFQENPVIVQSAIREHMNLLADFPGLGIVDSRTLPASILHAEKSLLDLSSMKRFLKSIKLLAEKEGKTLTEFTLQKVVTMISEAVASRPQLLPDSVNDLPVWPRISSKEGYLTGREAVVAQHSAFVVPWIQNYHQFTTANRLHLNASIDDAEMLERYVCPALPESIDENNKAPYIRLLKAIASSASLRGNTSKRKKTQRFSVTLSAYRLAARQDGKLCLASDLFDHTDPVFAAAFRAEATSRFLISEARNDLSFWYGLGIRRLEQGRFKGRDYLACLYALQGRLAGDYDQALATDTESILYPLCTNNGSLSHLDQMTWNTIASLPVLPVSPASGKEPKFRRVRMELLASQKDTLSLDNTVLREFAAVCWSQVPFALHEPSRFSLQQVGLSGQPSCAIVWQHLKFLAESARFIGEAKVSSFIEDVRRTYEFLHFNLHESKGTFSDPRSAIWLNVEATSSSAVSLDVLRSSWTSLENLLLDSPCNAPPLMTVKPFLGRFSSLLKDLGCKSLYYPPIIPPSPSAPKTAFALVRELWQQDVLMDVTFEAQGSTISAHKLILATRSLYCKTRFHGPWAQNPESNDPSKIIKMEEMAYVTLKILIDFCYHEDLDWAVDMRVKEDDELNDIADKLDGLLGVLRAADRWVMPDLHAEAQRHLIVGARYFIRPDNVQYVSKEVGEANATDVWNYCEEYRLRNAEAVLLANAEGTSSDE